jgi:serine/threonine protein kinase
LTAHGVPSPSGTEPRGERAELKLGRYEIVRELGKGAMGIVYLAKDPLIGRLVALKTIRTAAHADDDEAKEFQQRFIREAQAAGILNHPAIVTVHDIGQDETTGVSFIAMEYVEGQNLKEVLSQGRTLNFEQIGDIIVQVAEALDFAHSKGIVHRDVKPANIILIEGNRAKITDFGIAKIASGGANLTSTGQFLGTPNYMAPEQIKGAPVDGRTDLFSLGICLYECLTRRKPFGGDSLTSISYKIVHEPFPPLHEINPQIPDGYDDVVSNCLAKDPAKRYQRGKELATALRAAMRGERPVRVEPLLADETIVTRDKIPTIEIPFPDAEGSDPMGTHPAPGAGAATPQQVTAKAPVAPKRPKAPAGPSPLRRPIPAALFLAIVFLLIGGLAAAVMTIRAKHPEQRVVDTQAEVKHARERQLRQQANTLLRQGNVDGAYQKYEELSRLAPGSPAVSGMLQKLSTIRQQEMISKQQLALAREKFEQGLALYNEKKYDEAIPLLEESFHLNPNAVDAGNYLKAAQQEQEKLAASRAARKASTSQTRVATATTGTTATHGGTATAGIEGGGNNTSTVPAKLTTIFNSPVGDGYIMVKVGGTIIAHENLWEEKGRFFRRRTGRLVNVTRDVTPANTDLEIWVVIPSLQVQEHHTIRQNFQPGAAHKLLVVFNQQSKRFDYQFN